MQNLLKYSDKMNAYFHIFHSILWARLKSLSLDLNTFCLTYKGSTVGDTISGSIASLKTFNVKTLAKAKYSALNIIVHIADDLTLYPFFTLQNKKPRCYKNQCQVQRCMSNLTLPITIFYIQP